MHSSSGAAALGSLWSHLRVSAAPRRGANPQAVGLSEREETAALLLGFLRGLAGDGLGEALQTLLGLALGGVREQRDARVAGPDHRLEVVGDLPVDRLPDRLLGLLQGDLA